MSRDNHLQLSFARTVTRVVNRFAGEFSLEEFKICV
jgi:hypothetical protein